MVEKESPDGVVGSKRADTKRHLHYSQVDTKSQVVYKQGDLYTFTLRKKPVLKTMAVERVTPQHKRGKVKGFSKESRKRLMRLLARTKWSNGLFVTLTARDGDKVNYEALVAFAKRYWRRYGNTAIIWKKEPQKRGAFHYHLMIITKNWLPIQWVIKSWSAIMGESSSVSVRYIKSRLDVGRYMAKYFSKVSCEPGAREEHGSPSNLDNTLILCRDGDGRWWGILGREYLKYYSVVKINKVPEYVYHLFEKIKQFIRDNRYYCERITVVSFT